jgi:hypothetical protein
MYLPEMLGLDQEISSSNFQKQSTHMKRSENFVPKSTPYTISDFKKKLSK